MKTKYSKCKCGETAFDRKPRTVQEEKIVVRSQYRCRNCMRLLKTKDIDDLRVTVSFEAGKSFQLDEML